MTVIALLAADVNVAQNVGFYMIAAFMVVGAVRVVSSSNVVHAALWLVIVLAGIAAQYILAAAEFVAVSQVLVYIGAVMVLFLFGIMLTRAQIGAETGLNNRNWALGIPVAAILLGLLAYVIIDAYEDSTLPTENEINSAGGIYANPQTIADNVLSPYLVPFLALSFVLLAAAIGAIVLARKD